MNLKSKIITSMLLMASIWGSAPALRCHAQQPSFAVQVMSGADKEAAAQFAEKLQQQGFEASVSELKEKQKPVYKVRVGDFTKRQEAERLYETLRMKGIEGWVVQVLEQAPAAEKTGPASEQSHKPEAAQPPVSENAAAEKPVELIIHPVAAFAEDNKTAPSVKTQPAPTYTPQAAQQYSENAASEKLFELVIHPVPTFAGEEKQTAPQPKTEPAAVCPPAKTYKYFNPGDATLHIAHALDRVPAHLRSHIWEIDISPIYFKSLDLRDMSMTAAIAGTTVTVFLEGITRAEQAPRAQEVRDFEAALQANPLRIKYYPERTDPDGTLHGNLFFSDGSSVETAMIRSRLAACAAEQLSPFQQSACPDAQRSSEDRINAPAPPH